MYVSTSQFAYWRYTQSSLFSNPDLRIDTSGYAAQTGRAEEGQPMSAPAGWHLQPDGQERYWDGSQWTDQFRSPLPSDPTAPPSWDGPVDQTQAVDLNTTQAIPAPQATPSDYPPGDYPQGDYAQPQYAQPDYAQPSHQQPGHPQTGYQQPGYPQQQGYPQTGYGAPGGQPYVPPPRQGGGLAKGCLIVAIIGVLLLGAAVVAGIYLFNRASDTISENFPTDFPSDLPSGLPTEGLGQSIDVTVGAAFELPRATIESGWTLDDAGGAVVNITGMRATLGTADGFPVLFTMSFPAKGGADVQTVCTTATGSSDSMVDVSCVPLFGNVADAKTAKVTASL